MRFFLPSDDIQKLLGFQKEPFHIWEQEFTLVFICDMLKSREQVANTMSNPTLFNSYLSIIKTCRVISLLKIRNVSNFVSQYFGYHIADIVADIREALRIYHSATPISSRVRGGFTLSNHFVHLRKAQINTAFMECRFCPSYTFIILN